MNSALATKQHRPVNFQRHFIVQSFCWGRAANFLYLANAKAGSSNIKRALIGSALKRGSDISNIAPHGADRWDDPIDLFEEVPYTFAIVRNPYTRVLSAYLDKICRSVILREQFYWQHSIPSNEEITFEDFLRLLRKPGFVLDQHYRSQVDNIFLGALHIDLVLPLEDYASYIDEIRNHVDDFRDDYAATGASPNQRHATNSTDKIGKYYTSDAAAMVREIYKDDFDKFGYSMSMDDLREAPASLRNHELTDKAYPGLIRAALAASRLKDNPIIQESISDDCETASGKFFRRALLLKGARGAVSPDSMAEEAGALLSSAFYPIERYVALDLCATANLAMEEWRDAIEALDEMLHIAPYFASPQERAMRILARTGREQEATTRLDWLCKMTRQKERYAKILQEELNATPRKKKRRKKADATGRIES